jgi:hypothetical protein
LAYLSSLYFSPVLILLNAFPNARSSVYTTVENA